MIYLDNGATSFPKAPGVGEAMKRYIEEKGINISRSDYQMSADVGLEVLEIREKLNRILGFFGDYRHCIFTSGATMSLNMIMQGLLRTGDHLIISAMEHNAVARTASLMEKRGVTLSIAPCDKTGAVIVDELKAQICENTRLVVVQHASNVCGTIQPIKEIGTLCREKGIFFAVDTAQTAGHLPVCMDEWGASAVAFAGHKGLMGPQGIGGFIVSDEMFEEMETLLTGGTGSKSDLFEMPRFLPDYFEAGTLNLPGILGVGAALDYIEEETVEKIQNRERALTEYFLKRLSGNPNIRVPGPDNAEDRTGVISVYFIRRDNADISFRLEEEFGILTRCGLHCAPLAHKTLGTFPQGTVRFSLGYFSTEEEIDTAALAVEKLC